MPIANCPGKSSAEIFTFRHVICACWLFCLELERARIFHASVFGARVGLGLSKIWLQARRAQENEQVFW